LSEKETQAGMRLNKYIAHCGICNRRQAVDLIKGGLVKVNDEVVKNPAILIQEGDKVSYKDRVVVPLVPKIYVLMNKPKNVSITSSEGVRKSVLDIVQPKYDQALTAIGHMDHKDVGLLLLTNDEEVIQKYNEPDAEFIRVFHLSLSREMSLEDMVQIKESKSINNQNINISNIDFLDKEEERKIGIELIQGSVEQLRSLFASKDYQIEKLDCMNFANLTKKDLPRGWFRDLQAKEVVLVKHFV